MSDGVTYKVDVIKVEVLENVSLLRILLANKGYIFQLYSLLVITVRSSCLIPRHLPSL